MTDIDDKLVRILATREILRSVHYPYVANFIDINGIDRWLDINCIGLYKITARFNGQHLIHFEQNDDFTLYTLTWYGS